MPWCCVPSSHAPPETANGAASFCLRVRPRPGRAASGAMNLVVAEWVTRGLPNDVYVIWMTGKASYDEFKPLDGQFAPNVVVQVKNGPIDFQPREPFHPLFGAMPHTALMMEFQITKEYLGFATHQAYLGSLFEEVLQTDTRRRPQGGMSAT